MRRLFILLLAGFCGVAAADNPPRVIATLDAGWSFLQADAPGAEQAAFDDSAWRKLDLPHDWSIEGPFAEMNKTGGAGAFLPSGVGWYRKHLSLPYFSLQSNRVFVEFDGVMQNSEVWLNGASLGKRPFGYASFRYDLTPHLHFDAPNVLAVRCDTSAQPASRWYSGAGIYRHVRLVVIDAVHIGADGVFVATPEVARERTTVQVETVITNSSGAPRAVTVQTTLVAPDGKPVGSVETSATITNGFTETLRQQIVFPGAQLWSPDDPKLYRAVSKVSVAGTVLDGLTTTFGIRDAKFTSDRGFMLNGKKVVLKGVCLHGDGGAFGAGVPLAIWEDRLKTLRSLGVNSIRTAHNPPAPEFLDLCDSLGFLVMDEFFDCWTRAKNAADYHLSFSKWAHTDERDAILRDRNHPSVIMYSVGNEILDTPNAEKAKKILAGLVAVAHAADPTRPVTQALFRPNKSGDYTNGLADMLDVIGTNYRDNELLAAQRAKPDRKIINTEQKHERQQWLDLRDNPSLAGQFLWVGVDYLGESRKWPRVGYAGGLLDRTGAVKPRAFERQSWWTDAPMVHIVRRVAPDDKMPNDPGYGGKELFTQVEFADWTPRNPAPHDESVHAYSNCEEVELFLDGQSLGAQKLNADASPRVWKIPFAPGTLKAIAKNGGKIAATDELRTAGKPARLELKAENTKLKNSWDDVAIVRATVVDANGVAVPHADGLISFSVSGPGVLAAVDNADNDSHEPFQTTERHAYRGACAAFVKAAGPRGEIVLTATVLGLTAAQLAFTIAP